ncbi:MAG: hypothetical protein Q9178_001750 [Gyalolechia marmorata]
MDSRAQAKPAAGNRQYSSALGKRKPLGERSTNDKPAAKRQTLLTNWYHREKSSQERSTQVQSSRRSSSSTLGAAICDKSHNANGDFTDDEAGEERWEGSTKVQTSRQLGHTASAATIQDENLDPTYAPEALSNGQEGDITDNEVLEDILPDDQFDLDDSELLDSNNADDQAKELQAWFKHCDDEDQLKELGAEERIRRVQNYQKRFKDILESFESAAQGFNNKDWDSAEKRQELPFSRKWWQFFINMQTDKVLPLLMDSMPEAVKVILGGPLDTVELLMLPVRWKVCRLWGIYTDIMTNNDRTEVARYVGSGMAKDGIQTRLNVYPGIARGKNKSQTGRHADWLRRKDVQMNLRVAAVFNQCITPKPYVLLMELCNTVLLQTIAFEEPFESCTTATGEKIREAMPRDLPNANHKLLNRAAQCWQGLWFHRRDGSMSEGNKNREIHQTVPDHRVKLTPEGWKQAEEAGLKLRSLLRPDDTLHFFTSPYRRTRETTEGILNALTSSNPAPSPSPRHTIKVYEEPRLREQDFGNFQPGSSEMARMWSERAEYGHFFYRIPNGESAADAYDRVSGFNDTLWRSFGEDDFASVCVLVTHGLMTRVFLMKWYHFSVEYFEDLRNVDHCEFVVMKRSRENQKYILQNELRTWSEMRRERDEQKEPESPIPVRKRWAGFLDGYEQEARRRQGKRQNTVETFADEAADNERVVEITLKGEMEKKSRGTVSTSSAQPTIRYSGPEASQRFLPSRSKKSPRRLDVAEEGRDGGGSRSGAPSRTASGASDGPQRTPVHNSMAIALHGQLDRDTSPYRARANTLGDQSEDDEGEIP